MISPCLLYYHVPNAAELARLLLFEQCGFVSSAKSPFLMCHAPDNIRRVWGAQHELRTWSKVVETFMV